MADSKRSTEPAMGTPTFGVKRPKHSNGDAHNIGGGMSSDFVQEYAGYTFPQYDAPSIDRLDIKGVTAKSFFDEYVSKRKPVVISAPNGLTDSTWAVSNKWTLQYLKEKVGDVEVAVEKRANSDEKFGRGKEERMPFGDFINLLEHGSENYYLTTQDVTTDSTGRPRVLSDFMRRLGGDFPLRPELAGNLIPQNINVWLGRSPNGSSSGLHHDYHDNLYVIVAGQKKFDLYCPSDAPNLYTRGKLCRIHSNGRINYEGEETLADGSHADAERALDASIAQEAAAGELEEAEKAVARGEEGAGERLRKAEEKLDEAMEAVVDVERGGDVEDFDDGGFVDDGSGDEEFDGGVEEEEDFWEGAKKRKLQKNLVGSANFGRRAEAKWREKPTEEYRQQESDHEGADLNYETEGRIVDKTVKDPLNFSVVDTSLSPEELKKNYPNFAKARVATVEIARGEMLYLPASWFHEVTSCSFGGKGMEGHHMAFNYWFHPPDGASFDKPYNRTFWEKDWELRKLGE